ncbi:hypothetical protein D3C87_2014580 [compost metagenome]
MATELHHHPLHGVSALARNQLADLGRAGEAHGANTRIGIHAADDRGGIAGHHIEDTRGKPSPRAKFGKGER